MRNIQDRLSKLELVAGIKPKKNPFEVLPKPLPFSTQDWTTDELYRLFMGEELLKEKEAKTDWTEWESNKGHNSLCGAFLKQLTTEQLRLLESRIRELGQ